MAAAVKKYPSRIRYEENNPTVSFRISLEDYEQLDEIREEQGTDILPVTVIDDKILAKQRYMSYDEMRTALKGK